MFIFRIRRLNNTKRMLVDVDNILNERIIGASCPWYTRTNSDDANIASVLSRKWNALIRFQPRE